MALGPHQTSRRHIYRQCHSCHRLCSPSCGPESRCHDRGPCAWGSWLFSECYRWPSVHERDCALLIQRSISGFVLLLLQHRLYCHRLRASRGLVHAGRLDLENAYAFPVGASSHCGLPCLSLHAREPAVSCLQGPDSGGKGDYCPLSYDQRLRQ